MTPDRWAQIQRVLDGALKLDRSARAAYLSAECTLDLDLRAEVESLLGQASKLDGFLDSPDLPASAAASSPTAAAAAGRSLRTGEQVSGYTIIRRIGEGGMGVVYSARDSHLERDVALKFLASPDSPENLERFQREARAACALNYPNVCTVYGVDEDQGHPFLVMELLSGQTLRERLRQGPLPAEELIDLAIGMADALACAHAAGIIHRDIKPGNLFVTSTSVAKILDLGLGQARLSYRRGAAVIDSQRACGGYCRPSRRGEKLDARTDLFSFGSVLYEMAAPPRLSIARFSTTCPGHPRR